VGSLTHRNQKGRSGIPARQRKNGRVQFTAPQKLKERRVGFSPPNLKANGFAKFIDLSTFKFFSTAPQKHLTKCVFEFTILI